MNIIRSTVLDKDHFSENSHLSSKYRYNEQYTSVRYERSTECVLKERVYGRFT